MVGSKEHAKSINVITLPQKQALKVLVASGIDPDIRDMDGLTPADLADECDKKDCVDFLRSPSQVHCMLDNNACYCIKTTADEGSADKCRRFPCAKKVSNHLGYFIEMR